MVFGLKQIHIKKYMKTTCRARSNATLPFWAPPEPHEFGSVCFCFSHQVFLVSSHHLNKFYH